LASDFSATSWQILLCNAAAYGLTGVVVCAIGRGFDPTALLHVAARGGHCALATALLHRGADPNEPRPDSGRTPLHEAALHRTPSPVVQLLLDSKSDVNVLQQGNNTPLHMAAVCGHIGGVAALIAAGADPNAQNSFGSTPLHVAVYNGNLCGSGALLAAGADWGIADNYGKTPLDRAIQYRHAAIVDLLRGAPALARG
jgi:ankyrin repeat protein